ncbi:unnamed protein product [Rotaria magnacalcarata]|uniref:Uncharacterized protein n=1 Tax=Rotaria magnacalcarata TaxID=392030 RepID=A0A816QIZ7_9BILA|nr:unnamed protein product [Rotaria magnacalcarata]
MNILLISVQQEPNEDNIKKILNGKADVKWSDAGYNIQASNVPSKFPCIAKLKDKQHYVILTGNDDNKGYQAWNPSGDKKTTFASDKIGSIYASD